MDPGSSILAQSLRERITPALMVLPTPAVEESCQKNNLSFLELLRAFSTIEQIDVPVRTASDQPYRLQEFRLRLFYAADICQPTAEAVEEYLVKVVNNWSAEAFTELSGDPQKLDVIQQMVQSESMSSWFQRYSRAFIGSLAFSEHEAIDHPVACVRAVSSREENPINKLVDLYNTDQMPTILNDGAMDPKLLKFYVLVHDNQDGPADRANEILSEMRGTFGFNECWLLCINSGKLEDNNVDEEVWRSDMLPSIIPSPTKDVDKSLPQSKLGCFLNDNDLSEISELMVQLSCKSVLPYMEQKIRSLNQQVLATRKGLKNQIKNLWWRKGKDETAEATNSTMYTFSSIESQIRVLADYAFMLRDYELALSNYRLLSSDYKTDKAWKHYAAVQEMIGLSLFMLDQSRKEAELCMESAFNTYQKLAPSGQRYSTRCALWWAEMHKARGQYKEAASVFFRSSTEEPHLRAGVFLEQAAYCYLRATPPMLRKYGFHLVLAGNRYNVCGQKKHAFRAYMSVLTVFEGQGWNYINDHVVFHLGRLSALLGNFEVAVQHFMKLLACSHQSSINQAAFLKEFLFVVQNSNQDKQKMLRLDLPCINMERVRVHFEDQRSYASPAAAALPEDVWSPVELGVVPLVPTTFNTWLDAASAKPSDFNEIIDFNQCIIGEDLIVDVEFRNPLQIPLNLSAVSLICEFIQENPNGSGPFMVSEGLRDVTETCPPNTSGWDTKNHGSNREGGDHQPADEHQKHSVKVAEESFTLKAGEIYLARLKVVPYEQGILRIVGVRWALSDVVTGYRNFPIEGTKKKKGRGRSHVRPPHQRLKFLVLEQIPRLEVSLHGMPGKVNSGELHRVVLEISNTSDSAVKNLKFRSSQSGILMVGDPEDLDAEFPSCLEASTTTKQWIKSSLHPQDFANGFIYTFPQSVVLEGRSTLLWPLWLHAREAGTLLLNNILYYEADKTTKGLHYRTVRMSHTLQVFPSLRVSVNISPHLLQLEGYLLRLDIANEHSSESFWLRQVSCMAKNWHIAPLLPPVVDCDSSAERVFEPQHRDAAFLSASVCPSQLLPPGQTLSLFFQLLDTNTKHQGKKCVIRTLISDFISDVRLGPPSSSEPLIDVTTGPLVNFHAQERVLKEKEARKLSGINLSKLMESNVDIILISEQQDESSAGKLAAMRDSQRLATHHICHCSVKQSSALAWTMEGPRTVTHNFAANPSCNVCFHLTIKNCSSRAASVNVEMTSYDASVTNTFMAHSKASQGWYNIALENPGTIAHGSSADSDLFEKTDAIKDEYGLEESICTSDPFIWCSLNSLRISELGGGSVETYPFHVTIFAPGIYDLSGYRVSWVFLPDPLSVLGATNLEGVVSSSTPITRSNSYVAPEVEQFKTGNYKPSDGGVEAISGSGCGHPLILTVEGKGI